MDAILMAIADGKDNLSRACAAVDRRIETEDRGSARRDDLVRVFNALTDVLEEIEQIERHPILGLD